MKVSSPFSTDRIARRFFVASLIAALAVGVGAIPAAFAESVPAPVEALPGAIETSALASVASLDTLLVATATAEPTTYAAVASVAAPVVTPRRLTVRQIIAKVGRAAGLKTAEIDALMWLAKRESNFHPTSHSRSECHGLFQLSKGMAHGHPWKDPAWNTKRAIRYMRGRYGGVLKAKAFWMRHHWY